MSDQPENNDNEKPVEKEGEISSWNPAVEPPRKPPPDAIATPAPKRGSSVVAWIALLLIIALCVGAAWSLREAQRREDVLLDRLATLESVKSNQQENFEKLDKRLQRKLSDGLGQATSTISGQASRLDRIDAALVIQREEISRFGATDRNDWLLAEAEYLLRLANQRLIMSGDVVAAVALLRSADSILLELEDPTLHDARGAIAADLAALRSLPRVDVEGLYLRLSGLIELVDQLAIFKLPDAVAPVETVPPAEDWQGRLTQGYRVALDKLYDLIVIRRRDVPYEALMDPQWERLVRQNLRMLLEQSQVALLSGNQELFRQSLGRAEHWAGQFFEVDEAASRALAQDLSELVAQTISVEIPDVSNSIRQLDAAVQRRLQLEGGN